MLAALGTDNGPGRHDCPLPNTYILSLWARGQVESWAKKGYLHPGAWVWGKSLPLKCKHHCLGAPEAFCWKETVWSGGSQSP